MTRRSAASSALLCLPAVLLLAGLTPGPSGEAQAAASCQAILFEVVWTKKNGNPIPVDRHVQAAFGDELTAEIRLTPGTNGVGDYSVSLEFDTDLGDELDLIGTEAVPLPPGFGFSFASQPLFTQESTGSQEGNALVFSGMTLPGPGPTSGPVIVGRLTFEVTSNVVTDGPDVLPGVVHPADGIANNAGLLLIPLASFFRPAFVNAAPACSDGLDNDGDGVKDSGADRGCSSAGDPSERGWAIYGYRLRCDDGIDDDGDCRIDYPEDPGCWSPLGVTEKPQCSDGLHNDADGFLDFPLDPQCTKVWDNSETKPDAQACGIGYELGVVLPLLWVLRERRRRRDGRAARGSLS